MDNLSPSAKDRIRSRGTDNQTLWEIPDLQSIPMIIMRKPAKSDPSDRWLGIPVPRKHDSRLRSGLRLETGGMMKQTTFEPLTPECDLPSFDADSRFKATSLSTLTTGGATFGLNS
ncbi:hypothetical protein OIU84_028223 [Salix udensis]|uniref:Uncharacterized protein n=1 Tax=Salix udensis TaxID=889485 RepID=A0AAD6KC34_9ROSI|nr:hypothetical protein OIU84_028223 [Salix udensis]